MDSSTSWWVAILSAVGAVALNLLSAYLKPVTDTLVGPIYSFFSVKTLTRDIRENEKLKKNIENLAASKSALLTWGLHRLFVVLALFSVIFAVQHLLNLLATRSPSIWIDIVRVVLWFLPAAAATEVVRTLQRVIDYPASAEEIEKKTDKLRKKLAEKQTAG